MNNVSRKKVIKTLMKKEYEYCKDLEINSEEYNKCLERIFKYELALAEEKKCNSNVVLKVLEIAVCGVLVPFGGMTIAVSEQKDISFTGALKDVTKVFVPRSYKG